MKKTVDSRTILLYGNTKADKGPFPITESSNSHHRK